MSFINILFKHIDKDQHASSQAALCTIDYEQELAAKNKAIREFWIQNALPATPSSIIPSPFPRHYRTTTKRAVIRIKKDFALRIVGEGEDSAYNPYLLLEPAAHAEIYAFLAQAINRPRFRSTAGHLSYIIIRGNYQEFTVIFNIDRLDGDIVRALKGMADDIKKWNKKILSLFAFVAPADSRYYLDNQPLASGSVRVKKLYGHDMVFVNFDGSRYLFNPTVFSQVNHSLVPAMLKTAKDLLSPTGTERLIDLYCGYGLFSLYLAPEFKQVVGIEGERNSIESAQENIRFHHAKTPVSFKVCRINPSTIGAVLPPTDNKDEMIILDPPRQGVEPDVVSILAEREPIRVLHICCGVDEIPRQIREWRACGYQIKKAVPLDMFAGTPNLEMMIVMEK